MQNSILILFSLLLTSVSLASCLTSNEAIRSGYFVADKNDDYWQLRSASYTDAEIAELNVQIPDDLSILNDNLPQSSSDCSSEIANNCFDQIDVDPATALSVLGAITSFMDSRAKDRKLSNILIYLDEMGRTLNSIDSKLDDVLDRMDALGVELKAEIRQQMPTYVRTRLGASINQYRSRYPGFYNEKYRLKESEKLFDKINDDSYVLRANGFAHYLFIGMSMHVEHDLLYFQREEYPEIARKNHFRDYHSYYKDLLNSSIPGSLGKAVSNIDAEVKEKIDDRKSLHPRDFEFRFGWNKLEDFEDRGCKFSIEVFVSGSSPNAHVTQMRGSQLRCSSNPPEPVPPEHNIEREELKRGTPCSGSMCRRASEGEGGRVNPFIRGKLANYNRKYYTIQADLKALRDKQLELNELKKAAVLLNRQAKIWSRNPDRNPPSLPQEADLENPKPWHDGCSEALQVCECQNTKLTGICKIGAIKSGIYCNCD